MTADVAVAGIGLHPFGRFEGTSAHAMGATALHDAMNDASIARGDFQAAFCATAYGGVASGHRVLGALGLTGVPIVDVEAGCASGGAALSLAAGAIAAGQYDTVLVVGIEKMGSGMIRSSFFEPWMEAAGLSAGPAYFALRARRLMDEHGLGAGHLAELVVKNRSAGVHNPDAMFNTVVTADEVLTSKMVCDPLRLLMLCAPNEGAAAVVLRRADLAGPGTPRLLAAELRSHLPGSVLDESTPLAGIDDTGITPPSTLAAQDAWESAGVGPDDLDLVECQDTDAARELLVWHELGLCDRGEQARILAEGTFGPGGRLPVNQSGGLLSKGEPLGASGLGQVVELALQLRGEGGHRQVKGARVGLAHTIGRGANASVTILGTAVAAG
ncbi:MAG: thiolase family protein [Actinomycetota bacterium]|nr:thiolase family protein [Actinomycetes bacterium]